MADVYSYLNTATGVIEVDAATIQSTVSAEYQAVFGTDLVVPDVNNPQGSSTPQGLLINAETQARIAVADNNAALANQINPNVAGGVFLDAILALTGATRNPATQSIVYASLTGTPNTVIPAGSLASETSSGQAYQYYMVNTTTLDSDGNASFVQFNSVLYGAIPCAADSLTTIISNVIGWDSIGYNETPSPIGQPVQSDASARLDRNIELGIQGNSLAGAIIGAINAVLGEEFGSGNSVFFQENTAAVTEVIESIVMVSHSIYACVSNSSLLVNGSQSTVTVTLTGTPATSVPAGFLISETASGYNYQFELITTTVIGGSPTPALFQSVYYAPILAPIGSLTTIVNPLSGLASVTNAAAATPGTTSLIAEAMVASKSAGAAYNNTEAFTQTGTLNSSTTVTGLNTLAMGVGMPVTGVDIPASTVIYSITDATTIVLNHAATGSLSTPLTFGGGQGNPITALVVVPYSNQQMVVLYDTAVAVPILVTITVTIVTPVSNPTTSIQNVINLYSTGGLTGIAGLTVGQNVSAFEIAGAVTSQYPGIFVHTCFIAVAPTTPTTSDEIVISKFQVATIQPTAVTVVYQ